MTAKHERRGCEVLRTFLDTAALRLPNESALIRGFNRGFVVISRFSLPFAHAASCLVKARVRLGAKQYERGSRGLVILHACAPPCNFLSASPPLSLLIQLPLSRSLARCFCCSTHCLGVGVRRLGSPFQALGLSDVDPLDADVMPVGGAAPDGSREQRLHRQPQDGRLYQKSETGLLSGLRSVTVDGRVNRRSNRCPPLFFLSPPPPPPFPSRLWCVRLSVFCELWAS